MNVAKKVAVAKPEKTPRISVNKLAEYLEASSTRRKTIVHDAKHPKEVKFKSLRYREAREIMKAYVSGLTDEDEVLEAIANFEGKEPDTEWQDNDFKSSIASLEALLETDTTLFGDMDIENYEDGNELVKIAGVDISVNPDLIITKDVDGVTHVGALKFHISKSTALSEEGQNIVAVMLYLYAENYLKDKGDIASPKLCFSFDIFQESIISCPTAYKLRMKRIETACEEIALWWDKL